MKKTGLWMVAALLPLGCNSTPPAAAPPAATPAATVEQAAAPAAETAAVPSEAPAQEVQAPAAQSRQAAKAPAAKAPASAPPAAGQAPAPAASGPAPSSAQGSAPAAAATPAPRVRMIVPAGTELPLQLESTVSTATAREGDLVLASLTEDVPLNGFTLEKGAEVRGTVLTAVAAKRVKGRAHLVVGFDAVMKNGEKLAISTETIDSEAASTSGKDKKIIAGGAAGGLILGAIKDGKKGAVVGTVLGAAAGTGAVLIMKGDEVELARGARITVAVTK